MEAECGFANTPPGAYEGRQVAIEIVHVARTKRPDRSRAYTFRRGSCPRIGQRGFCQHYRCSRYLGHPSHWTVGSPCGPLPSRCG